MTKKTNNLIIILILLALLMVSQPDSFKGILFSIGDTFVGVEDFIPYSDFSLQTLNPDEWEVIQGPFSSIDFNNEIHNSVFIKCRANSQTTPCNIEMSTNKNLKGKEFKANFIINFNELSNPPSGFSSNAGVGFTNINLLNGCNLPLLSTNTPGTIEIKNSLIDENRFYVTINGLGCEAEIINPNEIVSVRFFSSASLSSSDVRIWNPRWKPILNCELGYNDVVALQVFDDQDTIDITTLQYPLGGGLKKFCLNNPVIIIKPDETGFDSEILQLLANGQTFNVGEIFGEGSTIVLQYIVDTQEAGISTICTEEEAYIDGICQDKTNLVFPFTTGTLNLNTLTLTVSSEPECDNPNAVLVVDDNGESKCVINPPEVGICVRGTLNEEDGTCELTSGETISNLISEDATQPCKDLGGFIDEDGKCITVLKEKTTFSIFTILLILAVVIMGVILFRRRR